MDALALGLGIGLAAGISPGPLLALVLTESLRAGWRAGVLVACAPLLTDALVVAATLLVLREVPERALAVLGVLGGAYVVHAGVVTWRDARTARLEASGSGIPVRAALRRAALVNLLSPHPWITWATALGPLTVATWRDSASGGVALVVGFYVTLVGAKAVLALVVGRGRRRLGQHGYRRALSGAAVLLVLAGLGLVAEFGGRALTG